MPDDAANPGQDQPNPSQGQGGHSQSQRMTEAASTPGHRVNALQTSDHPLPNDLDPNQVAGTDVAREATAEASADQHGDNYGAKTGASADHPYNEGASDRSAPQRPAGKDPSTPPDGNTEIDSEADLADPASR